MTDFVSSLSGGENIWVACGDGDLTRTKFLIEEIGISVNAQDEYGYSPLHAASSYNEIEILNYLLSKNADVHLRDNDGDTPILVCESPEVYEILLGAGADPMVTNTAGLSLFEIAVENELEDLINYLVSKGLGNSNISFAFNNSQSINSIPEGEEGDSGNDDYEEQDLEDTDVNDDSMEFTKQP